MSELEEQFKNREILPGLVVYEVMDKTGDTKYIWDPNNTDEVEVAKSMFERFTKKRSDGGKGFAAFHVTGEKGDKGVQMREFDPKAGRVIFVPPLAGG
jgi:hypothetical protein